MFVLLVYSLACLFVVELTVLCGLVGVFGIVRLLDSWLVCLFASLFVSLFCCLFGLRLFGFVLKFVSFVVWNC